MARVLTIMDAGDGLLDLSVRSVAEGHKVKYYCRKYDPKTRPIGDGLVERVADWRPHMEWADIVILEANGAYLRDMEAWRRRGVRIIGGNSDSAAWELDRQTGMSVFKKAGIPVPAYREFNDYDAAIRYVERIGHPMFSKPCSDTADKSLSAKTGVPEDPSWTLRKWREKHGRPPCPFLLQEPVDGVEFAVGAWFGPGGFAHGIEENYEFKRLFAGDIGPNCGEAGTVMRYVNTSELANRVLDPLEEELDRVGYTGNIDVNCIVDADGHPWPLEFTMRLGWPAFNIETALFDCDPIEFFITLAEGGDTRGAHRLDEVAVGVVLALPPYPNPPRDYADVIGVPIHRSIGASFHPCECKAGTKTLYETAGGYVGIVTGTGTSVSQAARRAYGALKIISMPASPFWRNDIGRRLKKDLPRLQEHGFAAGMEY
jgi:phosphoribosylamine---glycine ligase